MRRSIIITIALIAAIAAILCASSGWARGLGVLGLGGGAATPAVDYSDITFHWGAENSFVTSIPSGGGAITGSQNETPTFSSSVKSVGSYSAHRDASWDAASFSITSAQIGATSGQVGFWVYFAGSTHTGTMTLLEARYDGDNLFWIHRDPGDPYDLRLQWSGGGNWLAVAADANLSADTWYYVVCKYNQAAGSGEDKLFLGVYDTSGTLVASANTTNAITALSSAPTLLTLFGLNGDGLGYGDDMYMDNLVISDDVTRDLVSIRSETSYE